MSAPPSPHESHGNTQHKKKDRPPALDIPDDERKAASDGEVRYGHGNSVADVKHTVQQQQPTLHVSLAEEELTDHDYPVSRSTSTTSSLDPYYFGLQSPSDSPAPPLPTVPSNLSTTPDQRHVYEPVTPARDPAAIDRRGLVGVGELATPRWTREEPYQHNHVDVPETARGNEDIDAAVPEDVEEDEPDSPWTIEAVDGESSEREDAIDAKLPPRSLRTKPSIADESGGEEILYPRKITAFVPDLPTKPYSTHIPSDEQPSITSPAEPNQEFNLPTSPPSSFSPTTRRAKKRTSDEFEMDQFGALVSKRAGNAHATKSKDEKTSIRKHRSLNAGSQSTSVARDVKGEKRRRESVGLTINSSMKSAAKTPERHVRQTSASSSSNNESHHPRRVHTTDFSHLPPSPSSSSIQQFLRHPGTSGNSNTPPLSSTSKDNLHSSPNVAHSLLRGTQEGWSGLDDEATAEALRKLDGLSGKSARTRASVGSFGRTSSSSRPGTPAGKSGQWEGVGANEPAKAKRASGGIKESASTVKEKEPRQSIGLGLAIGDAPADSSDLVGATVSSDELSGGAPGTDKTPKKASASARSSFTTKRGSTSSTTYTSTPSSRDSASMSTATSMTSVSGTSARHSMGKARRNSAGSDVSSVHSSDATSLKDRVASLAINSDAQEDAVVPPVPPLPKDLSTYRSPPPTSVGLTFPTATGVEEKEKNTHDTALDRTTSLEVPSYTSPPPSAPSPLSQGYRLSQHFSSGYTSVHSAPESTPAVLKTPSKKWSFSSGFSLKLTSSPSSSSQKSGFPLSPRAVTFGQQLRNSNSKDKGLSSASSSKSWETKQPDAMASAGSLASLSSVGSVRTPALTSAPSKTPDRTTTLSRTGTGSSGETNHTTSGLSAPNYGPLSPAASIRRGQSKRLTPSSIPFFRRSSSQSMQLPPSNVTATSSSPTLSSGHLPTHSRQRQVTPPRDSHNPPSTSVLGSTHKKASVLSLGLPSLLKSSSRRSLHAESKEAARESQRIKDAEKEKGKLEKQEKERQKKEDKDRSESRISVLMGRKRGKTLSSTDPRKPKSPVNLPPMQMSALEPATAQRVARLKPSTSSTSTPITHPAITRTTSSTSRLTSQTVSSMQKQSDSSLRSRNQLPTIAGSPSVSTNGTSSSQTLKEFREPPSSLLNSVSGLPKETPTKIPRISSRTSAAASPPLKNSGSALSIRRTSANATATEPGPSSTNPSPTALTSANEFGVMEYEENPAKTPNAAARHSSIRGSPSMSTSRVPRQSTIASTTSNIRKGSRDSVSFTARKASTSSVTSTSTPAASESSSHHHRFSALSPSKLKLLSPKISLPAARASNAAGQGIHQAMGSPASSRPSLSTPSPVPSTIDEEELLGDEEMLLYIRRQQAKKMAAGATQEELDELLRFPEPLPPGTPSSPSSVLRNYSQYLSEFERKEILDYPSVYCYGAKSKKKPAVPENSTNNYGYDDERGDYLVVNKDHLSYRYEIIDTLGKGSFGQVLHCRDHCTGESVAVKIIRNKKRFHHQALVEIKILDNLRKWDSDGKHHVLKMIEHFYFRNHLCIATELLSINLYELIKANGFVGFTTALIRRFTSQMLMSLSLMRHHRIVHCDLKPENVLLRHPSKSAIKVIDFGSSCFEHEKIYTYIQSRFYRSPEVILGLNYHMAIDMWSLGCILAELYTGFPIFPGENEQEQLSCIMEVLGVPDKAYVEKSTRRKLFFDASFAPRAVVNSKGRRRRPGTKTLAQVLRCNDEEFVDFISKCLVWDPERRIKPQAAMRHPFVTAGRRPKPPPSTTKTTSGLTNSRSKQLNETPKKSLISAPTPLTARTSRTTVPTAGPTTPSNSSHASSTLGSSSRSYRASQPQGLSSYSSRTLNGFTATAAK